MTALSGSYSTSTGSLARDGATDNSVQHETQRRSTNRVQLHINHCGYTIFALLHLMAFLRVLFFIFAPIGYRRWCSGSFCFGVTGHSRKEMPARTCSLGTSEKIKRRWILDVEPNETGWERRDRASPRHKGY